jgi:hypothetical protein
MATSFSSPPFRQLRHLHHVHDIRAAREPIEAHVERIGNLTKAIDIDCAGSCQSEVESALRAKANPSTEFGFRRVSCAAGLGEALAEHTEICTHNSELRFEDQSCKAGAEL